MDERRTAGLAGTALGLGIGALLMYAMDPQLGARRRAMAQDLLRRTVTPAPPTAMERLGLEMDRRLPAASATWDRLGTRLAEMPRPAPRTAMGWMLGLAAIGAAVAAMSRPPVRERMRGMIRAQPVRQQATIQIDAPPDRVYEAFAHHENFPRYMSMVEEVRPLGGDRTRWVVKGPGGARVEWNSIVTDREPGRLLAWRSEPGSMVENEGCVRLQPSGSGTRATVEMSYQPPGGRLGHVVAKATGRAPEQDLEQDLQNMKRWIERGGDAIGADGTPQGGGVSGGTSSWMTRTTP